MSVFKVTLNGTKQGQMDLNPATGLQFVSSKQRTAYIAGPGMVYRKLFDGDQFTDCNYFKRFVGVSFGGTSSDDTAILSIVSDDGSVWLDGSNGEASSYPKVYTKAPVISSVNGGAVDSTAAGFAANNVVDILGDTGSYANYLQIINMGTVALKLKFNGDVAATMDLTVGEQQVFNHGDALISKLEFGNASGSTVGSVQVVMSVKVKSNS